MVRASGSLSTGKKQVEATFTVFGLPVGTGVGAVMGLLLSGSPVAGAATGAAVGLFLGAILDYDDVRHAASRRVAEAKKEPIQ